MISVLSQLTKTFAPEFVSIYIKLVSIGGKASAPEWDDGEFVFVDFIKFCLYLYYLYHYILYSNIVKGNYLHLEV